MFDELEELIEMSSANHINLCRMGGMTMLLTIIVVHWSTSIRKKASMLFNTVNGNNIKVQEHSAKEGAHNLAA